MIKKSLLLTLLLALFAPWAAQAQETLTVNDGTTTDEYVPVYGYYVDSQGTTSEFIIPANTEGMSDMEGGTISKLTFYISGSPASWGNPTIQLYLGEVEGTTLSGVNGPTNFTVVKTMVWSNQQSTIEVEFDEPYTYGGGNLLIGTYVASAGGYKHTYFFGVSAPSGSGYCHYSSSNASRSFLPKTTFTYEPAATGGCEKPDALTANGEPTATEFSFTIEGGSGLYNIFTKAGDGDWTNWEYEWEETTVDLTGLTPATDYQVRVQSVCTDMTDPETGDAATSGWKTLSFTTKNPCAVPTNLQVSDITAESATLSWTAGYQETEWTVKYKKSTDSEYTTETVSGTPTLTLSSLASNTTYNVQVYNCENYVSANFTTQVGIPLTEAFATTSAPAGWTRYSALLSTVMGGGSLGNAVTSGWSFGTTNGVFDSHTRVNLYGTSCKYWLVTPTLLMEDNVQLTFDLALTAYSGTLTAPATTGTDDKFVVLISTDNMATWTILRQWDNAGSEYVLNNIACSAIGETVAIDLSSYAGSNIAIAFYGESTASNADNNLHIDNVSIDYIPDCAKPTGLAASDVTAHEATITWTSDAAAWQICVNDDEENLIDVTETTYTLTGLAPETAYTVKVRTNCGDEGYSDWTTTVSFTTTIACPAPTALAVTPNVYTATFTWESFASEWEVAFATDATADPEEFIVGTVYDTASYTVNDLELGDYYFWVRANCGDLDGNSQWAGPASVHIGYCVPAPTSVDGNGISNVTFGMGDYIVNNDTPKATYTDYTSQIGAVQAGVEATIAITFKTGYDYNTYVWVDLDNSLSFEADEVVCYGVSTSANPTTLTLNFIIPADQTLGDFRLRIGSADSGLGSDPTAANPCYNSSYACFQDYTLRVLAAPSCLIPTDLTIDYTGGTEATISWTSDAEAWNMRVNGVDVNGVITNPYTLTGLELATTYSVEVQANCGEDGTSEWSNPVSFTTDLCMPENQCAIYYSFTDQYDDSWNGAYINIVDATTQEVLYELTMPNVTGPYEGSFNVCDGREIQFVWVSGSYPRECGYVFTHFGTTILEKATNSAAPDAGVFFTYEVNCTPDPCTVPYELMSSNVSYNQATLSWTGYSDTYYVQYRTAELRSGDWTEVTANTTTLDLTGLVSETTYEWQVRTDCDSIVEWSETAAFITNPLPEVPVANLDGGYWNDNETWEDGTVPPAGSNVLVTGDVIIGTGNIAVADTIFFYGGSITIEEGAELYHNTAVDVTVEMQNVGYPSSTKGDVGGFHMIASPINESVSVESTGLVSDDFIYDLFYFDQAGPGDETNPQLEWINYNQGEGQTPGFTELYIKKGYLYASDSTIQAAFTGSTLPTNAPVSVELDYVEGKRFAGWNLIGNPFTCMAAVSYPFYTMNAAGDEIVPATNNTVEVTEGIFVETDHEGDAVTFTPVTVTGPIGGGPVNPDKKSQLVLNLSNSHNLVDRALVRFGEDRQLSKFQFNPNHTKVYFTMDNEDYAIVRSEGVGELPVSFKAENNGTYNLSFAAEEVSFNYLHLIDNMTGKDVDMLSNPSYTFTAQTTDYACRFKLVFATGDNSNDDNFAFYSNGNFVINNDGEATLQVVDVMGRILSSQTINGSTSINVNAATGVYMLRLINGNDVKVQKVVVR